MFLINLHCLNDVINDMVEVLSFKVTKWGNRSLCTSGALDFLSDIFYPDPFQYNFTKDILYKV